MLIKHPRKPTARTGCCNSKALSTHGVHNVCIMLYIGGIHKGIMVLFFQQNGSYCLPEHPEGLLVPCW